jgi:hypothetical protein
VGRVVGLGVERVEQLVPLIGGEDAFEVVGDASTDFAVEIAA